MKKILPPALLAEVIAYLDPLTPFVEFLRGSGPAPTRAAEPDLPLMREFVGWLSADIPELHQVLVPDLADSLERFLKARAASSLSSPEEP